MKTTMPQQKQEDIVKELAPYKTKVSKAVIAANDLIIKTADDIQEATALLGNIKLVGKAITAKKFTITKPLNEALKNARAFFAPLELQYTEAEKIVKKKMIEYHEIQTEKANAKAEQVERKVESGKLSMDKAADQIEKATPQNNVTTDEGAAQFRIQKKVVIEDESQLPREYLVPDFVKIRRAVLGGVSVPGAKMIEEKVVAGITKI